MNRNSINLQLALFFVIISCFYAGAVSTTSVELIRDKDVLNAEDLNTIDNFIEMAISEFLIIEDFTETARLRSQITGMQSTQSQYRQQYIKSCKKYLTQALETAKDKAYERRHKIRVNLMILIYELHEPDLIDLALKAIEDEDKIVQYWAVKSVTNKELINHLETIAAQSTIDRIARELQKSIDKIVPEASRLIVDFVTIVNSDITEKLALKLVDMRLLKYEKYLAKPSIVDMKMLKLLCSKMLSKKQIPEFGPRFCQLYSYIFQRYIYYLKDNTKEKPRDAHMLASILAEIEEKCIGNLTGFKQGVIRDSIKKKSFGALELEHGRLLGDDNRRGEIPTKFNFNYGLNEDGGIRTMPKVLPQK